MDNNEKAQFIREVADGVRDHLLRNLHRVPEDWDGVELRQWMADTFKDRVVMPGYLKGKRLKNYRNEVLVRNL